MAVRGSVTIGDDESVTGSDYALELYNERVAVETAANPLPSLTPPDGYPGGAAAWEARIRPARLRILRAWARQATVESYSADAFEPLGGGGGDLGARVTQNEEDITALDGRVTTAEGTIAGHTTSIGTNASDITALDGRVDALEAEPVVRQVSEDYTVLAGDDIIQVDGSAAGGDVTVTLPALSALVEASALGKRVIVKNLAMEGFSSLVTVAEGDAIDSTDTITSAGDYAFLEVIAATSTTWHVVARWTP